jgi:hypothetical protein
MNATLVLHLYRGDVTHFQYTTLTYFGLASGVVLLLVGEWVYKTPHVSYWSAQE